MMHYERVHSDLEQVEKTIKLALKSAADSETERMALEESLGLIQQAKETCRLAQKESIQAVFSQGMNLK